MREELAVVTVEAHEDKASDPESQTHAKTSGLFSTLRSLRLGGKKEADEGESGKATHSREQEAKQAGQATTGSSSSRTC